MTTSSEYRNVGILFLIPAKTKILSSSRRIFSVNGSVKLKIIENKIYPDSSGGKFYLIQFSFNDTIVRWLSYYMWIFSKDQKMWLTLPEVKLL